MISPTVIGGVEAPVVGASSRSKILGFLSRLVGLRKRRLAIAGPGPVGVGSKFMLAIVGEAEFWSLSVLSWCLCLSSSQSIVVEL